MSQSEFEEEPLWRVLDAHGFQFRRTFKDLMANYPLAYHDPWRTDAMLCGYGQKKSLIDGLQLPMHFVTHEGGATSENFPRRITSRIRQSEDEYENFKIAVEQLARLFGPGEESRSSNHISQNWHFGRASVSAGIFPRDLNKPDTYNERHKLDPQSVTECSVVIETAYCPEPNETERDALSKINWIEGAANSDLPFVKNKPNWNEYTRRIKGPSPCEHYGFGIGPSDKTGRAYSDQFFIQRSAPDFFEFIPRNRIGSVLYRQDMPDRGHGSVSVWVKYSHASGARDELLLLRAPYERDLYRTFAIRLSHKLFCDYTETQTPFCELPS